MGCAHRASCCQEECRKDVQAGVSVGERRAKEVEKGGLGLGPNEEGTGPYESPELRPGALTPGGRVVLLLGSVFPSFWLTNPSFYKNKLLILEQFYVYRKIEKIVQGVSFPSTAHPLVPFVNVLRRPV